MSLLRSKATRVFYSDNGVLSDKTEELRTWGAPNFTYSWVAAEDALYIGRPHAFTDIYVAVATANAGGGTLKVEYWTGNGWVAFTDLIDETSALSSSGFIQWEGRTLTNWIWAKPSLVPELASALSFWQYLFWIKITLSNDSSANASLRAMSTLLSDDRLMTVVHPEIMNYLPAGQTDFLPQHELAKDRIVTDLINQGVIDYEEQIKVADDWMLAATYKCIEIVLAPIAGDERLADVKKEMAKASKEAMRVASASIDANKDEALDLTETNPGATGQMVSR